MLGGVRNSNVIAGLCGADFGAPTFFGVHNEPVAGGNIITARNNKDRLKFIVGEIGVFSVWYNDSFGAQMPIKEQSVGPKKLQSRAAKYNYSPEQYLLWKNAKYRIRELLLTPEAFKQEGDEETPDKSVLFVPQWAYHIDLQMLYVGKGRVVLHSFKKQRELIESFFFKPSADRTLLRDSAIALEQKYGEINRKAKETLEKHGFEVIEVAGVLPTGVDDGHVKCTKPNYYFCFMNGIALFPDKVLVPHHLETEREFVSFAYELFMDELRSVGIETVPIGNHLKAAGKFVTDFMLREEGGLRCKTTTLPRESLAALR
ncbi:hypothetical protein [Hyalangium versicolor]|uniref:hypothetical protein n=1 Tax=Hyalangium versicolor TaxID=2861190 RepID=UPI001CC91CCD|nr:hypothetical protein [Hyalangium versicolor]